MIERPARRIGIAGYLVALALGFALPSLPAHADVWTLDAEEGLLFRIRVKTPDFMGERAAFRDLTGDLSEDGTLAFAVTPGEEQEGTLDLSRYGTADAPVAVTARLDPDLLASLRPVDFARDMLSGTLSLAGRDYPFSTLALLYRRTDPAIELTLLKPIELTFPADDPADEPQTLKVVFRLVLVGEQPPTPSLADRMAETAEITGDPAAGKALIGRCLSCHRAEEPVNAIGPHLVGILGRAAGGVADYPYSDAMEGSGIVWDVGMLSRYLADPKGTVPGANISYRGFRTEGEIADAIAYLDSIGD